MGDWNTLHLIDEEVYKGETLSILESADLLFPHFSKYLNFCIPGKCKWTEELIKETVQLNKSAFSNLSTINSDYTENSFKTPNSGDDYHFRKFVTFLIFETCSDFYPYFKLGKSYVRNAIDINPKSVSGEILMDIFNCGSQFNWDGDGIRKIVFNEDLTLLLLDTKNITSIKTQDDDLIDELIYFLDFASKNGYGILSGQNLDGKSFRNNSSRLVNGIKSHLQHLIYFEKYC